jgi:hypothetical protein
VAKELPDGKPLEDRTLQVPAFHDVVGPLLARPTANTQKLTFTDPGPPATQGRVQVPTRPGQGGR